MDHHTHGTAGPRELQMARSMCWHCQSEVAGEYFCERCVKVQPVSKELDYFTCLGFPRRLTIDQRQLEAKFYDLSRAFHPDFYQNKSAAEQTISLGNSAMLNTAYRTLRDPIERAEYLLDLEAGSVKEIRNSPPADLFEEILELARYIERVPSRRPRVRNRVDAPRETPIGTAHTRTTATGHGGHPAAALCSMGRTPRSRGGDRPGEG